MEKKKRLAKEATWFFCTVAAGIILSLSLYRILGVDISLEIIVLGAIVALVAVYVIRLTLWVLKESM